MKRIRMKHEDLICLQCKKQFPFNTKWNKKERESKKFCSNECKSKSQIGVFIPNGSHFKKGLQPWNKGKTGYLSKEIIDRGTERLVNYIKNETLEQRLERTFKIRTMEHLPTMFGRKEKLSPQWKGENATYNAKHRWVQCNWQKTGICEFCLLERPPRKGTRLKWGTHWANKSGEYKRDRNDWYELCPKCHKNFDSK